MASMQLSFHEAVCVFAQKRNFQIMTMFIEMVGLIGLEPMTPALSRRCSNQLSYRPFFAKATKGVPCRAGGGRCLFKLWPAIRSPS